MLKLLISFINLPSLSFTRANPFFNHFSYELELRISILLFRLFFFCNKIFIILSLLSFVNIYGSGFSDDINHYHYGFITNSDELNLIWGYTYLHPLYGTMPLWLVGHSYFNFDYSRLQDIHVLNGIIFFLVSALFLEEFKSNI